MLVATGRKGRGVSVKLIRKGDGFEIQDGSETWETSDSDEARRIYRERISKARRGSLIQDSKGNFPGHLFLTEAGDVRIMLRVSGIEATKEHYDPACAACREGKCVYRIELNPRRKSEPLVVVHDCVSELS